MTNLHDDGLAPGRFRHDARALSGLADLSVLAQPAALRMAAVAAVLAGLWLAVLWAANIP